jgi:hypothetical protein
LAGYLTGLNVASPNGQDLLKEVDIDLASDWVDEFCRNNPKSDVIHAIDEFFRKMKIKPWWP